MVLLITIYPSNAVAPTLGAMHPSFITPKIFLAIQHSLRAVPHSLLHHPITLQLLAED